MGLLHVQKARLDCLLWIQWKKLCLSNPDSAVQSAGYNSAQSPTNWEEIHGKDPSIFDRPSSRLSIALDDKTQTAKSKIVDWHKKFVRIFLIQNVLKDIENLLSTQIQFLRDAKRPEIWDVPDLFRCMCEFEVRKVMSLQNSRISNTHIL